MESSAHGKVLLLGGYLVLFPEYFGVVVECSPKITTLASHNQSIVVDSPRFKLSACYNNSGTLISGNSNPFVEESLKAAIQCLGAFGITLEGLRLEIQADEEFYTSGKTGLGSSAALVVSLTSAILKHCNYWSPELLHFCALLANAKAQKKIGSGFDISCAIFGSQVFQRSQSKYFADVLEGKKQLEPQELLQEFQTDNWDKVTPYSLHHTYQLVLCVGGEGSDTRNMVKGVLSWKTQNPEESQLLFNQVFEIIKVAKELLETASNKAQLKQESFALKRKLKEISDLSDQEVLPSVVFEELKALDELEDVVFSSVPGAGGYDAFYCVVEKPNWEEARNYLLAHCPRLHILNVTQNKIT